MNSQFRSKEKTVARGQSTGYSPQTSGRARLSVMVETPRLAGDE